jgi:hypothetical protein
MSCFFNFINFLGAFNSKRSSYASQYIQIYLFSWQLPIIFTKKQIKYHVYQCSYEFWTRPAFPTSVKKVNTSFKNVWRTWGPALPTLLADLMIFCPLGPMNFKNSDIMYHFCSMRLGFVVSWYLLGTLGDSHYFL